MKEISLKQGEIVTSKFFNAFLPENYYRLWSIFEILNQKS